jgi:hypothetical protein
MSLELSTSPALTEINTVAEVLAALANRKTNVKRVFISILPGIKMWSRHEKAGANVALAPKLRETGHFGRP